MARIVSALYKRWAYLGIDPWLEYVASAANLSDDPSRGKVDELRAMGATQLALVYPPVEYWGE